MDISWLNQLILDDENLQKSTDNRLLLFGSWHEHEVQILLD